MAGEAADRMVESAVKLLAVHGFQATTFSSVLKDSGAPRGSIYYHFPEGKDQLIAAAIDLAGNRALEFTESFRGLPATEIVEAFAALWRAILVRSQFRAGCAVLAVTVSADDPELVERAAAVFRSWRERLGQALEEAGVDEGRARGLAVTIIAACEGATVLCRAEKSLEPLDAVAAQLRTLAASAAAG
ncbi:MAG TPA: TetR/AcrR family transcriptional regulator [Pseudonocardiaceae bacterium]|nr:TetR/AcrR family transcriptional regulator [Pseudonocardiaceae bacterium]